MAYWLDYLKKPHTEKSRLFFFYGPDDGAKKKTASAISYSMNKRLVNLDLKLLLTENGKDFETLLRRILRDALVHHFALVISRFEILLSDHDPGLSIYLYILMKSLSRHCPLVFITSQKKYTPKENFANQHWIEFHFPVPESPIRKQIWDNLLNGHKQYLNNIQTGDLANMYRFTESQIEIAVADAKDAALVYNEDEKKKKFSQTLIDSCRKTSHHKLPELAKKIESGFDWHDIILPKDQIYLLKEITYYFKHRETALKQCGLHKSSSGKSLNVLFSGTSGTGKTMAAEIMSNELQLELYKIDLSAIVSKYIGETEKNLAKIFAEAQCSNAILFFDEADALFGKRSEVKNAHDRYANIQVGYLLQKIEEYDGMTILASNLEGNIDKAFKRRIQFIVRFHPPDTEERQRLWQKVFSEDASISDDIDFDFLIQKIKLTGANIKNIAVAAACYAAEDSSEIAMSHIMLAIRREYEKIGEHFYEAGFKPYYHLSQYKES